MFMSYLSRGTIKEIDRLTSDERKSVLIIDDSTYSCNRSKKVELLSRFYDHVERKCYKGFTLLSVGRSDGRTFIPVNFKLLGSGSDDNLLERSHIKYDKRTLAAKRRLDARTDKPSAVLSMLRSIKGSEARRNM
jgi:hypothetical protein